MRRFAGGVSAFALMIGLGTVAHAQTAQQEVNDPDTAQLDEIIVTGIRSSLQAGVEVKRDSVQFVDSVVAEDIGKLPDINIAESLQRVSGVQVKRSLGEGTQVSIRGLNQNIQLINGRDLIDASGRGGSGLDTLGTGSYGILAQLPSEIIQRLDVTKLAASSDVEGALSGTINIITARPLANANNVRAFSLEGLFNDRAEQGGVRGSALYTRHFSDNFAGLLNISYSRRNISDESSFSFSGYQPLTSAFDTGATANTLGSGGTPLSRNPNGAGAPGFYLADIRQTQIEDGRERLGVNGTLQWQPTENSEISFDLLYSDQTIERDRYWYAANLSTSGNAYTAIDFSPTETIIAGVINTSVQTNTERYVNDGTTLATGLNGKIELGRLTLSGDASYSKSEQDGIQTFLRLTSKTPHSVTFDFRGVDVPSFTVAPTLNLLSATQFNFTNYFDNRNHNTAGSQAYRIDAVYALDGPLFDRLRFGYRRSDLDVEIETYQSQLGGSVSADAVPDSYEIRTLNILQGASGYTTQTALFPRLFGGNKTLACEVRGMTCQPRIFRPLSSYTTGEVTDAFYAQVDMDTDVGGRRVQGNFGLRYINTTFEANGSRTTAASATTILPVSVEKSYDDALPSLSLRAELTDDIVLRFGAAKVIARPNSNDQNPGLTLATVAPFTAQAGNAELEPFRATQYDFAAEWYFRPSSILSIGLFKKDLESFIVRRSASEVYDGTTYIVNRPVNGADASIKGLELIYQDNFTFLPAPFDGLGVQANYTYIDSETQDVNQRTGEALPLTGLSENNVNLVVYYETDVFGIRLAYNWRDKYLDSIGSGGDGVFFDDGEDLSLSARWQLNEAVSFDAQVSNLLDSRVRKFGGVEDATALFGLNGRTFSLALRGKF